MASEDGSYLRAREGAEKAIRGEKNVPQRLKPHCRCATCGTAEAVPLSKTDFSALSEVLQAKLPERLKLLSSKTDFFVVCEDRPEARLERFS
jgi:hypothetical protein